MIRVKTNLDLKQWSRPMTIGSRKSPETILREALEVARDELKRVNDHYSCVRPDPFGVVLDALHKVPALAPIENASEIEKRIVGKLVRDILAAGYCLTIWNGGDEAEIERCADEVKIFATLAASDQDEVVVYHPSSQHRAGWVHLVWGNDTAVISDYTTNFEAVLAGANALANELEG
jgi:hypothetical protein